MKKLSSAELELMSSEDRFIYFGQIAKFKWEQRSFEEKDNDILSSQEFYANRRGIEGMNLEEHLDLSLIAERTSKFSESYTFFWITKSPFSQWHRSNFTATTILNEGINDLPEQKKKHVVQDLFPLDVQEYSSAEQFMMYHKAMIFLDREVAQQIMQSDDVRKIKNLGRQVKKYDEYVWKYFRSKVVYEGNKAKFTQNEELRNDLFATKGTTLVESAPNDNVWGIGLAEDDARAIKRETWLGKNLLGEILTQIRIELMGEY
ncbi:N-glycosidase YbiA [Flavobacterium sp. PL0002]|nr:N-glycosidase YbiA [Flavobacterium sp. PL002]